ncbi:VOC family protein [Streptacidiphilus anmyonensis]|uniref:VOC family protein n=1 Tax=Streptacidiphilus anmyonensis TaxID=405782 RepID=UPI00069507B3|nr:VOC family protein [Streptacidiphilus anmyonensis]
MPLSFLYATVRVRDVRASARFWSEAVGRPAVGAGDGALVALGEGPETPGVLLFEDRDAVPQATGLAFCPPRGTLLGEVERLTALGATVVGKRHRGFGFGEVTMADPEGNQFVVTSGTEEWKAFENDEDDENGRVPHPDHPFWADAEQPPDRSVHGSTFAVFEG